VQIGVLIAISEPATHDISLLIIDFLFCVSHFGRKNIICPLLGTAVVIVSCKVKSAYTPTEGSEVCSLPQLEGRSFGKKVIEPKPLSRRVDPAKV
jgi:hypothetical protein